MRTSTFVMIGFAVLFGLLAVFLAQIWLNNQADERLKSIDAQRKAAPPARSIVVAGKPLRFGDELNSAALREMPWPDNALPAGAIGKIADLTSSKRIVLMPIDTNEAVLAAKITGPGQRATLSAMLSDGMKAAGPGNGRHEDFLNDRRLAWLVRCCPAGGRDGLSARGAGESGRVVVRSA